MGSDGGAAKVNGGYLKLSVVDCEPGGGNVESDGGETGMDGVTCGSVGRHCMLGAGNINL